METFGRPVEIDPADALLQEVHRTAGHVAWLAEQVRALDSQALTRGTRSVQVSEKTGFQAGITTTKEAGPQVDLWLELYFRERQHLVKVCAAALAAGVEERRVRLAEQQGGLLASVIRAVLDDLQLSEVQRAMVAEVVPRHLRAVAG
ncbi:MAG TPA: hypothetical protein VI248_01785 [Kineosporiaceae bacterium]